MIRKTLLPALSITLLAAAWHPLAAAEPDGDRILRQMSDTLAAAKAFRLTATRNIDASLLPGLALPGKATVNLVVQRPDKLASRVVGKGDVRKFIANGRTLTLFDEKKNFYATVPMRVTLDKLIDILDTKFGFTPPLAEFALSDPYKEFRRQSRTVTYLGRGEIQRCWFDWAGLACDRLELRGPAADAELWIGVNDHLPRRLIATFHRPGRPQLRIDFLKWNLRPDVSPSAFAFTPPTGAQRIEIWTAEKLKAARKH